MPIPDAVAASAKNDEDGDALDSLVLLYAAWLASRRPAATWLALRDQCERENRLVEGDFLD